MKRSLILTVLLFVCLVPLALMAQNDKKPGDGGEKPKGPPPSVVEVSGIRAGQAEPMAEYVGTIYYSRTSEVSSEVEGKVERVLYHEGDRVKKGQRLVLLSSDILRKNVNSTRSSYQQVLDQLEKAEKDLERIRPLYEEGAVAEALYDENLYKAKALKSQVSALRSQLESLELQLDKKAIRAPYSGVILSRTLEEGEWVSSGGKVAVMADDSVVEAIVEVPENILGFLSKGRKFDIVSGGRAFNGELVSIVPKGDVSTRTFTVKLRMKNRAGLFEGMEARAVLPTGPRTEGLLVNRDAIVNTFGMQVVYIVAEGMAKMIPVQVTGYDGMSAAVAGPGLAPGMMVVVKGNERLMQGNVPVMVKNAGPGPAESAPRGPDPKAAEGK